MRRSAVSARRGTRGLPAIRQVLTELSKVVRPTRRELLSYTGVVIVFVVIMMAIIYGLDFVFGWAVAWVFGDGAAFIP